MAQVTYPGVYIEEFDPPAPIAGVGTSTAAFLGPAADGPVLEPTKVTSWKGFLDQFADDVGMPPPGNFYLWYGVRGFFENGGQVCYVVRVSNAGFGESTFTDRATSGPSPPANDRKTIVIRARRAGLHSPPIKIQIGNADVLSGVTNARVFRPTATVASSGANFINVTDADEARKFMRGDEIIWAGTAETTPVLVDRVEDKRIFLQAALAGGPYTSGGLRLANLEQNRSRTFRLEQGGELLGPGSVVVLAQASPNALSETGIVQSLQAERITGALTTYRVTLRSPVGQDVPLTKATTVSSPVFSIIVDRAASPPAPVYHAEYLDLSMDPLHPRYFASVVAADDTRLIDAQLFDPPSTTPPPFNQPRAAASANLGAGTAENLQTLSAADYQRGLDALRPVDDVNFVAIPDGQDPNVQAAELTHCESMQDRFAIFDSRKGAPMFGAGSVDMHRNALDSAGGYGALYYPWLEVPHASGTGRMLVPPSGHVAGIYARTDLQRGVHKAPAGEEATVRGALAVETTMSDVEQGQLNVNGIDVIRVFRPGGRPVVWGARTTATDPVWQYVNIRRLFLFLEESIAEGINWAVFEPNNLALWQGLKRTIGDFLRKAWRDGALFGATPEQAFYVRIDEILNPFSEQALGRLNIEIGARPSYPAEFIVVRIGIWDGGSEISE